MKNCTVGEANRRTESEVFFQIRLKIFRLMFGCFIQVRKVLRYTRMHACIHARTYDNNMCVKWCGVVVCCRADVGRDLFKSFPDNNLQLMVESGAKGSMVGHCPFVVATVVGGVAVVVVAVVSVVVVVVFASSSSSWSSSFCFSSPQKGGR